MTVNDSKSYLPYFNKLLDQHNKTYYHYINKKISLIKKSINAKFKVNDKARITRCKNIFSKCYTENWSKEIIFIDSVLKTSPWTYKIKDLNETKKK